MSSSILLSEVLRVWKFQTIRNAIKAACRFVEEPGNGEKKKERVKDFLIKIWEEIDPTPNLNIDDWIVEKMMDWMIDWTVEDMNESIENTNPS